MSDTKKCERCGRPGPYKSSGSRRCVACDQESAQQRKEHLKLYHRARARALSYLADKYHAEFEQVRDREFAVIVKEEAAKAAAPEETNQ